MIIKDPSQLVDYQILVNHFQAIMPAHYYY